MQELNRARLDKDQSGVERLQEERSSRYEVPDGHEPAKFSIVADMGKRRVLLSINKTMTVSLSIEGARDLAKALRRQANLTERGR